MTPSVPSSARFVVKWGEAYYAGQASFGRSWVATQKRAARLSRDAAVELAEELAPATDGEARVVAIVPRRP